MSGRRTRRGLTRSAAIRLAGNGLFPEDPSENPRLVPTRTLLECRECQSRFRVAESTVLVATIDPRWIETRCRTCNKRTIHTIVALEGSS